MTDIVFYVGGAVYEGIGVPSFRKYDATLPIGDMHQIHGKGAARREVMFTLPPQEPASRLICGLTWGEDGAWTSWPPHQHERDLEEAYCYFDMDAPKWGFHLSYLESGNIAEAVVHRGAHRVDGAGTSWVSSHSGVTRDGQRVFLGDGRIRARGKAL